MDNVLVLTIVALWACILGLGFVVLALVRQVGVLSERIAPAGALMIGKTALPGEDAPELTVEDLGSRKPMRIGAANDSGKSTLLFFVAADCPVCKTLLPAFKSASKSEANWLSAVLATDGEPADVGRFIQAEKLGEYPFVNSRDLGRAYGVSRLPYAVLIGSSGEIESSGLVNSREHFDSLFNARDEKVASLQDYMQRETRRRAADGYRPA